MSMQCNRFFHHSPSLSRASSYVHCKFMQILFCRDSFMNKMKWHEKGIQEEAEIKRILQFNSQRSGGNFHLYNQGSLNVIFVKLIV